MQVICPTVNDEIRKVKPLCPVFGECGGCQYQDIPYDEELRIKEDQVKTLFKDKMGLDAKFIERILPSPSTYHYRNRLDLKLIRTTQYGIQIGFSPEGRNRMVPVDQCPIAHRKISDFIPELKKQVESRLPQRYRTANLVVRTGDDEKVKWGGIGRRSLQLKEADYFWTVLDGKRIFYSLDTFFQANLSILPAVIGLIRSLSIWSSTLTLYDLYCGVGVFGICLADLVKKVIMIEDNPSSVALARHNTATHALKTADIHPGKVEEVFPEILNSPQTKEKSESVALLDPPRAGLSPKVIEALNQALQVRSILYLSCHPESLVRDLKMISSNKWQVKKVFPLDFFPKTKHIEILVWLEAMR